MLPKKEWERLLRKVPMIATDGILIENGKILLIERTTEPYGYALPGGCLDYGETLKKCVVREVWEETGLKTGVAGFLGIYDNPKRDSRGHLLSAAFLLKKTGGKIRGSNETKNVRFYPINKLPKNLVLDHRLMINDALKLLRKK